MPLSAGTRLGHYDVSALLGEGGMAQVWQATRRYDRDFSTADARIQYRGGRWLTRGGITCVIEP